MEGYSALILPPCHILQMLFGYRHPSVPAIQPSSAPVSFSFFFLFILFIYFFNPQASHKCQHSQFLCVCLYFTLPSDTLFLCWDVPLQSQSSTFPVQLSSLSYPLLPDTELPLCS